MKIDPRYVMGNRPRAVENEDLIRGERFAAVFYKPSFLSLFTT